MACSRALIGQNDSVLIGKRSHVKKQSLLIHSAVEKIIGTYIHMGYDLLMFDAM